MVFCSNTNIYIGVPGGQVKFGFRLHKGASEAPYDQFRVYIYIYIYVGQVDENGDRITWKLSETENDFPRGESLCIEQKELSLKIDMDWILQVHVQLCIYYCTVYVVVGETEAAGFQRGINAPSHPLNEILETIKYWR